MGQSRTEGLLSCDYGYSEMNHEARSGPGVSDGALVRAF